MYPKKRKNRGGYNIHEQTRKKPDSYANLAFYMTKNKLIYF
ncbi:hypothetical protein C8N37_102513 [Sphingobacterium faecium]|nr:hypothetical protein C8N37_102513 [Sphingobacterium faecium]